MQLATSYAGEITGMLEDAQDVGLNYAVFPLRPADVELKPQHFVFFERLGEAQQYLESKDRPGRGWTTRSISGRWNNYLQQLKKIIH